MATRENGALMKKGLRRFFKVSTDMGDVKTVP